MIPLVSQNLDAVQKLCRKHRVRQLDLFGSAARVDTDSAADDLDFLVDFHELGSGEYFDAYFDLLEELQQLFLRPVDLVTQSSLRNRYFIEAVNQSRTTVYAA